MSNIKILHIRDLKKKLIPKKKKKRKNNYNIISFTVTQTKTEKKRNFQKKCIHSYSFQADVKGTIIHYLQSITVLSDIYNYVIYKYKIVSISSLI